MQQQGQTIDELIRQGESLFSEGRLDEAEKYFLSLLLQYPSVSNIQNNLGAIKFSQGDMVTAKGYFISALAIDEDNDDALSNLNELYRNSGETETSTKSLPAHQDQRAIFLGGTGRSGTTLITRLLNRHRDLAAFGEVKVLMSGIDDLMRLFKRPLINREADVEMFKGKWTREYFEFFVPWKPKKGNDRRRGLVRWFSEDNIRECLPILDNLKQSQPIESGFQIFGSFVQTLFSQYTQREGKRYWAEKTPANVIYAPILAQCFSEIKIVNVVRDGRDVACSLREMGWGTQDPYKALDWWAAGLEKALEAQRYLPPNKFLNIRYEDIVRNPEITMRQVIGFLNLDWDDNLLAEPVYSQSIGRYKNELSNEVQRYALERYGKHLSLFNYKEING